MARLRAKGSDANSEDGRLQQDNGLTTQDGKGSVSATGTGTWQNVHYRGG